MSFDSDVKSAFAMGLRESWNDCLNDYSPRNWRDVRWSLIWLTTSAKCHCRHSRLYIYNLSSEALVRLPVKVLKTQQNSVLIISWPSNINSGFLIENGSMKGSNMTWLVWKQKRTRTAWWVRKRQVKEKARKFMEFFLALQKWVASIWKLRF